MDKPEKQFTPKQVAFAVLEKVGELLHKSEVIKAEKGPLEIAATKPSNAEVKARQYLKESPLKKGETENSKKLGYKLPEAGRNEKQPESSDKAFNVEGKDSKSSNDPRLASQSSPEKNPKEQAEGNNELAGTTPTQVGQDGKNVMGYDEMKGHLKLAKFLGRMEHKRTTRKV